MIGQLHQNGVSLRALEQNLDTCDDSPIARAMVQLLGMFAELERNFIVTRTQEGKAASGNYGGRPSVLEVRGRAEVNKLYHAGVSKRALAQQCQVSRQTIQRVLYKSFIQR